MGPDVPVKASQPVEMKFVCLSASLFLYRPILTKNCLYLHVCGLWFHTDCCKDFRVQVSGGDWYTASSPSGVPGEPGTQLLVSAWSCALCFHLMLQITPVQTSAGLPSGLYMLGIPPGCVSPSAFPFPFKASFKWRSLRSHSPPWATCCSTLSYTGSPLT